MATPQLERTDVPEPRSSVAAEKRFQGQWPRDQWQIAGGWSATARGRGIPSRRLRSRSRWCPAEAPPSANFRRKRLLCLAPRSSRRPPIRPSPNTPCSSPRQSHGAIQNRSKIGTVFNESLVAGQLECRGLKASPTARLDAALGGTRNSTRCFRKGSPRNSDLPGSAKRRTGTSSIKK